MVRRDDVPEFGVLAGVRVVYSAVAVAAPFCATIMAEHGADVIWIENAKDPDPMRIYGKGGLGVELERRNQRTIALDLQQERGRTLLIAILKDADIFVESSKGGQFERWGLTDAVLWAANPRLVILHISGFGLEGDPNYIRRPSYDPIAQAFGGTLQLNGFPDRPPISAQPYVADHLTALFASTAALAALHKATKTGIGESIDLAQFEVMVRTGGSPLMAYLNDGVLPEREGDRNRSFAGVGAYLCKNGEYLFVTTVGSATLRKTMNLIGLDMSLELLPLSAQAARKHSGPGDALDAALEAYCAARTVSSAAEAFTDAGIPCSPVYTYPMAENDPHYKAREVFTEWANIDGKPIRGANVFPKYRRNPGQIWRGAPSIGKDNEDILHDIGVTDPEIAELYALGVISAERP